MAERLSITRQVKLLESTIVRVPTAIGAFRPVILFPASVFTGLPSRGLEALIAHELAHVRRHDYLVNLLQTMTETLLFYHPAVWWVSARVRADREQCCDDLAIAATGDARTYARALMRLEEMRGGRPTLAVAAAGGNLWKRIVRLLTQAPASVERPSGWLAGGVALGMLLLLGAAARVGPSTAIWQDETDAGRGMSAETIAPDVVVRASARSADVAPSDPPDERSKPGPEEELAGENGNFETDEPDDSGGDAPEEKAISDETNGRLLTVEELALFRNHGVTADYVRAIALLGYDRAQPEDILSLKIHGVTPGDIAEMNRIFGKQPLEQHVTFKIHGVTPDAVRKLSSLGLGKLSADDAVSMKIHGVDADYVERLRAAGYPRVSADDVVSARIHGVAPGDAAAWSRLGYAGSSLEDLVSLRIHGVTPEFASEVRALGFSNPSLDDLVAFRIHGVTADFLREMKSLGFGSPAFSSDEALAFRIHGVTPEFVRGIRSLGYSDASADDLVALRIHGVSTEQIRKDNARAGRRLTLDEHVERCLSRKDRNDES
jgi:hypothetical protein